MAIQLHSNFFPLRTFLILSRAINFVHDNKAKNSRDFSMLTSDGPGPWPTVKFWYVDTNQVGNKEVKDPTNPLRTVYVHGGQS